MNRDTWRGYNSIRRKNEKPCKWWAWGVASNNERRGEGSVNNRNMNAMEKNYFRVKTDSEWVWNIGRSDRSPISK